MLATAQQNTILNSRLALFGLAKIAEKNAAQLASENYLEGQLVAHDDYFEMISKGRHYHVVPASIEARNRLKVLDLPGARISVALQGKKGMLSSFAPTFYTTGVTVK
ncbi:hypothetical protein KAI87_09035 [Myxococcota bacterium]|nr:hypothetical protein [Myxococcota bacterium]